jgi:asparagine synthase (glutamine-hydrolysing)
MAKANALCSNFQAALTAIAERTVPSQRCIILSGGVDTCAILAGAANCGVTFAAAITVLTGDTSPDTEFAIAAAKGSNLQHHIVKVTSSDLVDMYLPACVQKLATFDGMTLRNSLVVAAAMRKASELGFKDAIVGDGADELFGGYSFMWGFADDPSGWRAKRDKMCAKWTFATDQLAAMVGMQAHSPYTEPAFVEWAITNTERHDCIGSRPIRLVLHGEAIEHQTGKLVLREAYDTVSSWRRKDPIEIGSGITIIGHDPFWSELISDQELQDATCDMLSRGYVLKNKEHLANFRAFEQAFGRDGNMHPQKKRLGMGEGCAGCCFEIGEATFCDVCGAYPAQR